MGRARAKRRRGQAGGHFLLPCAMLPGSQRTVSGEGPFQLPPSSALEGSLLPGVSSFTLLRMLWSRVRCPYPAALTLPS